MITKVVIKNCFSIYDQQVFDFRSKKYDYKNEYIQALGDGIQISNPVAVYGYNGSGKTVVLKVLKYIYDILAYNKSKILMPVNLPNLNKIKHLEESSKVIFYLYIEDQKKERRQD